MSGSEQDKREGLQIVLRKMRCPERNDGSLKACIIVPNWVKDPSDEWEVGLKDPGNGFYLLRPTSKKNKMTGVYKHAYRDLRGDDNWFLGGENPLSSSGKKSHIKGSFEDYILEEMYWNVFSEFILLKQKGGRYKLPSNVTLPQPEASTPAEEDEDEEDEEEEDHNRALVAQQQKRSMASRSKANNDEQIPNEAELLKLLLLCMAGHASCGSLNSSQSVWNVFAIAAIIQISKNSPNKGPRASLLCTAQGFSTKGQGHTHAEELALLDLSEQLAKKNLPPQTHGRELGLLLVIVHDWKRPCGQDMDGSMCSSCVCALCRFVEGKGLNPALVRVKYPTRPPRAKKCKDHNAVRSLTAFRECVDMIKVPDDIEFRDSKVNDYQDHKDRKDNGVSNESKPVGEPVVAVLRDTMQITKAACHWQFCSYKGPHHFEGGATHSPMDAGSRQPTSNMANDENLSFGSIFDGNSTLSDDRAGHKPVDTTPPHTLMDSRKEKNRRRRNGKKRTKKKIRRYASINSDSDSDSSSSSLGCASEKEEYFRSTRKPQKSTTRAPGVTRIEASALIAPQQPQKWSPSPSHWHHVVAAPPPVHYDSPMIAQPPQVVYIGAYGRSSSQPVLGHPAGSHYMLAPNNPPLPQHPQEQHQQVVVPRQSTPPENLATPPQNGGFPTHQNQSWPVGIPPLQFSQQEGYQDTPWPRLGTPPPPQQCPQPGPSHPNINFGYHYHDKPPEGNGIAGTQPQIQDQGNRGHHHHHDLRTQQPAHEHQERHNYQEHRCSTRGSLHDVLANHQCEEKEEEDAKPASRSDQDKVYAQRRPLPRYKVTFL